MTRSTSPFEPLKTRDFLTYWLAGLSANFGWQVQLVAASWLMVSLGGTAQQVALVQTMVALPVMALSLIGGAITDRIGQKTMVLWAQSFLMIVFFILATATFANKLTPHLLLACTFLVGAGRALYYPGWQSMVFEFFERDKTAAAFAINTGNLNIARSLGPALGGAIVASFGAFFAFVISAFSNICVILIARRWKLAKPKDELPPEPIGSAIMAGVRYVAMSPRHLTIIVRAFSFNIAAIAVMALLPLIARDILAGGPQVYGYLLGSFGLGAVTSAFLSETLRQYISRETYLAIGFFFFSAAMFVLAKSQSMPISFFATFVAGICWIMVQVSFGSTNQISSPRWVISRSIGIYQTFVFGGNALGSILWGYIAQNYDTSTSLITASIFMAMAGVLGLFLQIRDFDSSGLDPQQDWVPPKPNVDMVLKSGPVITSITYNIKEEDTPRFLEVMREKRRSRIRDGASQWTLSRDILYPNIWVERFQVATWADTQRLHLRRTVEAGRIISETRKLHQGEAPPEVHYELVRNPATEISRKRKAPPDLY